MSVSSNHQQVSTSGLGTVKTLQKVSSCEQNFKRPKPNVRQETRFKTVENVQCCTFKMNEVQTFLFWTRNYAPVRQSIDKPTMKAINRTRRLFDYFVSRSVGAGSCR